MWRAPQQRELQHSEQWDLSRMQPPWHCSLPQVPGVASSLPQQSPDHCQQRCSTLSPGRQRCHGENWNKSKHTALVDGYTCGNWREGQGTPPGRHSVTPQRECIFSAMFFPVLFASAFPLNHVQPSCCYWPQHCCPGAELVLLLQPALLLPEGLPGREQRKALPAATLAAWMCNTCIIHFEAPCLRARSSNQHRVDLAL